MAKKKSRRSTVKKDSICTFIVKFVLMGPSLKNEVIHSLLQRIAKNQDWRGAVAGNPSVGSYAFIEQLNPKKIHYLDIGTDPSGKNKIVTCVCECEQTIHPGADHGHQLRMLGFVANNRGPFTLELHYCKEDASTPRAYIFKTDGNAEPSAESIGFVSPLSELQLSGIIKAMEDLNELFSHLSPEMYDRVHRLVYNRLCGFVRASGRDGRLDLALSTLSETMRLEVSRAEQ